eukprot:jgi/Bigna1/76375/fgenesh1_pg.40_\
MPLALLPSSSNTAVFFFLAAFTSSSPFSTIRSILVVDAHVQVKMGRWKSLDRNPDASARWENFPGGEISVKEARKKLRTTINTQGSIRRMAYDTKYYYAMKYFGKNSDKNPTMGCGYDGRAADLTIRPIPTGNKKNSLEITGWHHPGPCEVWGYVGSKSEKMIVQTKDQCAPNAKAGKYTTKHQIDTGKFQWTMCQNEVCIIQMLWQQAATQGQLFVSCIAVSGKNVGKKVGDVNKKKKVFYSRDKLFNLSPADLELFGNPNGNKNQPSTTPTKFPTSPIVPPAITTLVSNKFVKVKPDTIVGSQFTTHRFFRLRFEMKLKSYPNNGKGNTAVPFMAIGLAKGDRASDAQGSLPLLYVRPSGAVVVNYANEYPFCISNITTPIGRTSMFELRLSTNKLLTLSLDGRNVCSRQFGGDLIAPIRQARAWISRYPGVPVDAELRKVKYEILN